MIEFNNFSKPNPYHSSVVNALVLKEDILAVRKCFNISLMIKMYILILSYLKIVLCLPIHFGIYTYNRCVLSQVQMNKKDQTLFG